MNKITLVYDEKLLKKLPEGGMHYAGSVFAEVEDAPTWGVLLQMLRLAQMEAEATISQQKPVFNKVDKTD
jgi:hypothetical protein